jgi:hypothetical protein
MPSTKNPKECTVQVTTIKPSTAGLGQTSITSSTSPEAAKFSVKATASLGQSTVSLRRIVNRIHHRFPKQYNPRRRARNRPTSLRHPSNRHVRGLVARDGSGQLHAHGPGVMNSSLWVICSSVTAHGAFLVAYPLR